MKIKQIGILALTIVIMSSFKSSNDKSKMIFDFSSKSKISSWRVLNDGVMGGLSSSTFKVNDDGNGIFEGKVSTANNGGFASVRYSPSKIEVNEAKVIKIRLKGDSKAYQFRIKDKSSSYYSYITTFKTSGEWETIEINLSDLYPSFRGRKLDKSNFNASSFEELSFLIGNKKNEPFKLELDKIEII